MKRFSKPIIISLVIFLFVFFAIFGAFKIAPGSYVYAQHYRFNVNLEVLFKRVEQFKLENPEFNIPRRYGKWKDSLGTNPYTSLYLFYDDENQIVHLILFNRSDDPNHAIIGLNAIGFPGNWEMINKDFDRRKNLEVKKQFRERILDKLNLDYKDVGNGMFVFWK